MAAYMFPQTCKTECSVDIFESLPTCHVCTLPLSAVCCHVWGTGLVFWAECYTLADIDFPLWTEIYGQTRNSLPEWTFLCCQAFF